MTTPRTREALVNRLASYETVIEVGIGARTDVASALASHVHVIAVDVQECSVPPGVAFVRDDITAPQSGVYAAGDAIYALNCPPELQRPLWSVAQDVNADCLFTTLGGDPALVDAESETLPGETLFWVCNEQGDIL